MCYMGCKYETYEGDCRHCTPPEDGLCVIAEREIDRIYRRQHPIRWLLGKSKAFRKLEFWWLSRKYRRYGPDDIPF